MGSLIHSDYQAPSAGPGVSGQEQRDQYLEDLNRKADIYHNQQGLASALQAQMAGTGPNPAQLQYQANVGNNIANAQGLIASQRGLNPALAARMGVNAASSANQNAALSSALLQQQQQLGATANLQNLYGQMQGGNLSYLGQQNGMQQGANQINAGVAQQNAANNTGVIGGLTNAAGGIGSALITGGKGGTTNNYYSDGGEIKGKAKVAGDSETNDTVPAMLSPGEIVLPRSVAHDPEKAKEFVDSLLENEKKKKVGYGDVVKARRKKAA